MYIFIIRLEVSWQTVANGFVSVLVQLKKMYESFVLNVTNVNYMYNLQLGTNLLVPFL